MAIKYKTFAAYAVLKADDLNTFIMPQTCVYADLVSELASIATTVKLAYVAGYLYVRNSSNVWQRAQTRQVFAHLRQIGAQTLPDLGLNGYLNVDLQQEDFDTDNGHNPASFPARWFAPVSGIYRISGGVAFDTNASGVRGGRYAKNDNTVIPGSATLTQPLVGVPTVVAVRTVLYPLNAGDFVTLQAVQASGGPLNLAIGNNGENSTLTIELVQAT